MNYIMTKPKAINCKKLVAFVLPIIAKGIRYNKLRKLKKGKKVDTACQSLVE